MTRRLFTLLSAMSFALFLATLFLWSRSYREFDTVGGDLTNAAGLGTGGYEVYSRDGRLCGRRRRREGCCIVCGYDLRATPERCPDDDKPFFLKMSFHRPHSPYDPPGHWFDFYKDADLPKPVVGKWSKETYGSFTSGKNPDSPRGNLSQDVIRNSRQGYYGAISFVDEQIGRMMDTLQSLGRLDNTLILFCADHGDMLGDHHLWRKTFPYEASTRIPMIVRWPDGLLDAKRGQILRQLVELRDVLPTFLDAAGIAPPSAIEGKSRLDLVRGKTDGWRTQLDLEHSQCYFKENVWTALTDGHFKYIYQAVTGQQQLFDLDHDPGELTDLARAAEHAEALRAWRGRLIEHLAVRGPRWVSTGDLMLRPEVMVHGENFPA